MATLGTLYPTLSDRLKRIDPNGAIAQIVESLEKKNEVLQDIAWKEGNLPTGHRYTSRTALPSLEWRRYNQGISPSKSATAQVDEVTGLLTGMSKVDRDEAELNGDEAAFRASEDKGFAQAFPLEVARAFFYENISTAPERINGLTPRLNATAGNPASSQIIKADATASGADQTSIWLIGWGDDSVFGLYPKGSQGGLSFKDMGLQLTRDSNNKEFWTYVTDWRWKLGICVKDYRYIARAANIDTSAWKEDLSAGANLIQTMRKLRTALYDLSSVQPVYYMNRATFDMFNAQLQSKSVNLLEYIERGGAMVAHFMGIPIRICDAITSTESVVS